MLIFLGTFSGLWLAFIGWFLLQASAEARAIMRRARPRACAWAT